MSPAQTAVELGVDVFVQLVGLAVLAGVLAAVAALCFRWYVREVIPTALALLIGLSGVAVYLNTTAMLEQVITGGTALSEELEVALFNSSAFLAGIGGALTGRRAGDHFTTDVILSERTTRVDSELSQFVRHAGRVITVTVPEEIDDVVGYDPVAEQTKESIAGESFVFPRNLTVEELRTRFVERLKSDYAVGTVDVELAADGTIEFLAIGSRAAGIGPTLPPATNAVAVRADPAFAASTGDLVQVWEPESMQRVLTGEVRGIADDVVTLAIDSGDTPKVDPRRDYRLVTLPVDDRPEREFASLLRSADQTFSTVTVEAGSPLHGLPVGALSLLVIAVEPEDDRPVVLPDRARLLAPGDTIAAIGLPESLRRLDTAAEPLDPALLESVTPSTTEGVGQQVIDTEPATADETTTVDEPATADESMEDTPATPAAAESRQPSDDGEVSDSDESPLAGQADASTFSELQAELEASDPAFEEMDEPSSSETNGSASTVSDDRADGDEPESDAPAESGMFDDDLDGIDFDAETDSAEEPADDLSGLDLETEADTEAPELNLDAEDDLSGLDLDDGTDDESLAAFDSEVAFEDDGDDETDWKDESPDDNEETVDEEDDTDENADDKDESDDENGSESDGDNGETDDGEDGESDDDGSESDGESDDDDSESDDEDGGNDGGGGGSTFAQLKEEFESGDADWEDDISDSPGGDMRLDE